MLQNTRARQRASDVASAHAAVTARRPKIIFGATAAALLGVTLTVGFVSAPAAGDATPDPIAAVTQLVSGDAPAAKFVDDAAMPLIAARDAVDAATELGATVVASGLDLGEVAPSIDTTDLSTAILELAPREEMSGMQITLRTADIEHETAEIVAATATLQTAFTAAQEKKAAEDAAAAAAAQAAAEAAALASANTPDGARATAADMAASRYGWGADQFSCLNSLWNKESSWNYQAYNPSGATGIPQALPGSKMASAGSDWETNASTQIAWGLGYISSVYGTPCSAWSHSQATDWY